MLAKVFSKLLLGGTEEHEDEMRAGMLASLEQLRLLAEGNDPVVPEVGSN